MKHHLILLLLLLPLLALAQPKQLPLVHIPQDEGNIQRLREINRDIWMPFSQAYAEGDDKKYIGLHTSDLIRATGGEMPSIQDIDGYQASSERHFKWNKENGRKAEIAFTFFERVAGPGMASERGIYRYTAITKEGERSDFYGRFHVFLRKVDGTWKIAVDYDSNEDGTIGKEDFEAGVPEEVFSK